MKNEWRNMFFGWAAFAFIFFLFIAGFAYAIIFTNEPIFIKAILCFASVLIALPLCACLFCYMPDAWAEWHNAEVSGCAPLRSPS